MNLYLKEMKTPVGRLFLVADDNALRTLAFESNWPLLKSKLENINKKETLLLTQVETQLSEYFEQKRKKFDIPIHLEGTAFQKKVWQALSHIPYGQTATYQEQAIKIKSPHAVRAVGRTNGLNPISIILPCHRVIGKSGKLTGYAGGLSAKEFLLRLEKSYLTKN